MLCTISKRAENMPSGIDVFSGAYVAEAEA